MPKEEIRGSIQLAFVDPELAKTRPREVEEKDIPPNFDDAFAHENETLRNLDMFFFCDENGRPLSLEILDLPKDQRPRIMGFGTIVEHLPQSERPLPIKPLLPSPAFPSRSKKRPRADRTPSPRVKAPIKRASGGKSRKKPKVANELFQQEQIHQGDGEFEAVGEKNCQSEHYSSIFQHSNIYRYHLSSRRIHNSQYDGPSDSGSGESDLTSDDEDADSHRSMTRSEPNSEAVRSVSSGSGSDSGNCSSNSSSSSGSDGESSDGSISSRPASASSDAKSISAKVFANGREVGAKRASGSSSARKARKDPQADGLHPDVAELMRTDRSGTISAKGTADELNLMECGFRHPPEYARARVWLPEITDWCLDFSEGDPTLWVVTPVAWYKIAGPLSGLLPHQVYRETFQHVRMLFEACYLVAYVLKEWLPINKKVSYRATLQQVIELSLMSRYRVVRVK